MKRMSDVAPARPDVTRRSAMQQMGAAALATTLPALPNTSWAATAPVGQSMRSLASDWLALLSAAQRDTATSGFESRTRRRWNYMLGSAFANGLALERMSALQKDAAMALLATALSPEGLATAENIMLQQDILRDELGKGAPDRNRERFSVQIYGTPAATGAWAWRWEGHHLSLTFTILDDEVVSTTPSAFSSEPNTVPSGPHRGLVVLKEEESLARTLFTDLTGPARTGALVWPRSPGNILSTRTSAGQLAREQAGVPLGDLSQSQADMALRLVEVYTTEVLPPDLARTQSARLRGEDSAAIRFAWGGENLDGSIYYRLTGANLFIEFATLRNQPQHLHAVFHDTARNFGAHVL